MKRILLFLLGLFILAIPATVVQASNTKDDGRMLYGIGSTSKLVTSAAVMRLVDMGMVDLDEPISTYMPDFTMNDPRYVYITPRMLLNHSAGFMGTVWGNAMLAGDSSTYYIDNFLGILSNQRLIHHPGERSIYNNDGFTVAEILIERVSGISFTNFIKQELFEPLGIANFVSPQSDFDRDRMAPVYLNGSRLLPESLGVIGSGGLYATMEDLARFGQIFMDNADGIILSPKSVNEMNSIQHKMDLLPNANTVFRYGLGWDVVDLYPFNTLGIQALSKGGRTNGFSTDLTVIPEFNLAVAISASGSDVEVNPIVHAIILEILMEEGLIPSDTTINMPELNLEPALIPSNIKTKAGSIYDTGVSNELFRIDFTDYTMLMHPIAGFTDRPLEFLHNTDGVFVSIDGNSLAVIAGRLNQDAYATSLITFYDNYILVQTYSDLPGLGIIATSAPFAQRLEPNTATQSAQSAWDIRSNREFLLVNERHSSLSYISSHVFAVQTHSLISGFVTASNIQTANVRPSSVRIIDENNAQAFSTIPTMGGRDGVDIRIFVQDGVKFIELNHGDRVFMDAAFAKRFSELNGQVAITDNAIWVDIDDEYAGQTFQITTPANGSWFVYDDRMNPIATSLERQPRNTIVLPHGGRIAFVGEPNAIFTLHPSQLH
ncbi:MAG: beta-lactamase family protein [Defluviitaleaceae bacterium]|nr:beta-lactamase family protein [Defluviitaleaceae bacterium]